MKATQFTTKQTWIVLSLVLFSQLALAQEHSAGVNIDNPNPNAVLHLVSPNNDQGLLIPKLTTAQRTAMPLTAADVGIMVFDSDLDVFFFWSTTGWIDITNTDSQDLANVLGQGNDAGGNAIVNVQDPTNPQDVATKNYVDSQADSDDQDLQNVLLNGNDAGGNVITNVLDPSNPLDVANKNYVDLQDHTDDQNINEVLISGNDAGGLQIGNVADPVLAQDVATKNYVDSQPNSDSQDLASVLGFGTSAANSIIADVADPLSPQDAATKNYVDSQVGVVAINSVGSAQIIDGSIVDADISDVSAAKVTGLGTAATQNTGTAIGDVLQFATAGTLPVLDGSNLTNVSSTVNTDGTTVTGDGNATPLAVGSIDASNVGTGTFADARISATNVTQHQGALSIASGQVTGLGTAATQNTGTAIGDVLQFATAGTLPILDGSNLTNVTATVNTDGTTVTGDGATPLAVGSIDASNVGTGTFADARISATNVTQHQGALSIANGQVTGLGTAATQNTGTAIGDVLQFATAGTLPILDGSNLTNVTATVNTDGSTVTGDGDATPLAVGSIDASNVGTGTFADARIAATNVTQHQGALSIANGQVTGLGTAATQNTGTAIGDVLQFATAGTLPILDGSNLTNVTATVNTDGTTVTGDGDATPLAVGSIDASNVGTGTFADARIAATNVTQHQGALSIANGQVTGLGTAATQNVGTAIGDVLQFATAATLPILDGSNLTGITISTDGSTITGDGDAVPLTVAAVDPSLLTAGGATIGQILEWDGASNWVPVAQSTVTVPDGTSITGDGDAVPLTVAAVDPSLLTAGGATIGQILEWDGASNWVPVAPPNLQDAYDNGNAILTSGGSAFDVSGSEAISLDGQGLSNFSTTGGNLDFNTFTTGNININSVQGLNLNSADNTTFDMSAFNAVNQILTISASNGGAGNGDILMTADGDITINPAGNTIINNIDLTSPDITASIDDLNGNEIIRLNATGGAVNEVEITNAPGAAGPTLGANGDDLNVDLNITTKGSGNLNLNPGGQVRVAEATQLTLSNDNAESLASDGNDLQITSGGDVSILPVGNATISTALEVPQIQDVNDNELLIFNGIASAVNEISIANNAAGLGPIIETTGVDANIDLNFIAKGTGSLNLSSETTVSGGDFTVSDGLFTTSINTSQINLGNSNVDNIDVIGSMSVREDLTFDKGGNNLILQVDPQTIGTGTLQFPDLAGTTRTVALSGDGPSFQMGFFEDASSVVFGSSIPIPAPVSKIVEVVDDDNNAGGAFFGAATFNSTDLTANRSTLALLGARGTQAVPANVDLNDVVGEIIFNGHDGTNFSQAGYIQSMATETWSGVTNGAQLVFGTTTNSGGSQADRLTIDGSGDVIINGGDFILEGDGSVASSLILEERTDGDFVGFKAPDDITNTPVIWTLPDGDGTPGQVLSTDGATATLDWIDAVTLPYQATIAENGQPLLDITNSGTNEAARFGISDGGSSATVLAVTNEGSGPSILVEHEGLSGGQSTIDMFSYQAPSTLALIGANGDASTPANLNPNDVVGTVTFGGYDGTFNPTASIEAVATGLWDGGGDRGSYLSILTTPSGQSIPQEMARIGDNTLAAFADGGQAVLEAITFNTGVPSQVNVLSSGGTEALPSALQDTEIIGELNFIGNEDATGTFTHTAGLFAQATQNWSLNNTGSQMFFITTPNGTSSPTAQMVIENDGNINMFGSGALRIPAGDMGSRPGAAVDGMIRFNTSTFQYEAFNSGWAPLGGVSFTSAFDDDGNNISFGSTFHNDPVVSNDTQLEVAGSAANSQAIISGTSYSSSSQLTLREANGNQGGESPTALNDFIGEINFAGYSGGFVNGAVISAQASELWGANYGTALSFHTTAPATPTLVETMRLEGSVVTLNGEVEVPAGSNRTFSVLENTGGAGNSFTINAGNTSFGGAVGGNLNLGAGDGSGAGNGGNVVLRPGTGNSVGSVRIAGDNNDPAALILENEDNTGSIGFRATTSGTSNVIYTLPDGDGINGQLLSTNGSGLLDWANPSGFTAPTFDDADNTIFGVAAPPITVPPGDAQLGVVVDGASPGQATLSALSFQSRAQLAMIRAQGTESGGAAALATDQVIGDLGFIGYDGSAYNNQASIRGVTTEAWTGIARGAALSFQATAAGGTATSEMMRLENNALTVRGESSQARLDVLSASAPSQVNLTHSNGTVSVPTAIGIGETMGELQFISNYGGVTSYAPGARIVAEATQTWALNTYGTRMLFNTTPDGTNAPVTQMAIQQDGNIDMFATGALTVHAGTTGQRPGTPVNGMVRYNSTTNVFEGYTAVGGGSWNPLTFRKETFQDNFNFQIGSANVPIDLEAGPNNYQFLVTSENNSARLGLQSNTGASELYMYRGQAGGLTNGQDFGRMFFRGQNASGGSSTSASIIIEATENWGTVNNFGSAMIFNVANTGGSSTLTEQMRIDGDGNVGIGTPTPGSTLDVNGDANIVANLTLNGNIITPEGAPIAAVAPISADIRYIPITAPGAYTNITTGTNGQEVILESRVDGVVILDRDNGGFNVELTNNRARFLTNGQTIHLIYDGTNWREMNTNTSGGAQYNSVTTLSGAFGTYNIGVSGQNDHIIHIQSGATGTNVILPDATTTNTIGREIIVSTADNGSFAIDTSGGANIRYQGNPLATSINISGSGGGGQDASVTLVQVDTQLWMVTSAASN